MWEITIQKLWWKCDSLKEAIEEISTDIVDYWEFDYCPNVTEVRYISETHWFEKKLKGCGLDWFKWRLENAVEKKLSEKPEKEDPENWDGWLYRQL